MTVLLLFLSACASSSKNNSADREPAGEEYRQLSPQELAVLMPASFVDQSGFIDPRKNLDSNSQNLASSLGQSSAELFPIFPMVRKNGSAQNYSGLVIPSEFIDGPRSQNGAVLMMGNSTPRMAEARRQMSQIPAPKGKAIVMYENQGSLYGTFVKENKNGNYVVAFGRSSGMGLDMSFGSGADVFVGEKLHNGISLEFFRPYADMRKVKGFNAAQSVNQSLNLIQMGLQGNAYTKTEDLIKLSLAVAPHARYYLAKQLSGNGIQSPYSIALRGDWGPERGDSVSLARPIDDRDFDEELQQVKAKLKTALPREIQWRKDLASYVAFEPRVDDARANHLMQTICNQLATVYQTPQEIWPRCVVFPSWAPNAWAYPGGDIFVTAGLLGVLSDLDSLIYVLGHELSHVMGRHSTRAMPARNIIGMTAYGLSLTSSLALSAFSLSGGMGVLGNVTYLTYLPQMAGSTVVGTYALDYSMRLLMFAPMAGIMAHQRSLESQADRLGHQVALASGAEESAMETGWQDFTGFAEKYFGKERGFFKKILSDHPDGDRRLVDMEKRSDRFNGNLSQYAINRLDPKYYQEYAAVHEGLKPYVEKFGQSILDKRQTKHKEALYFDQSLSAPASLCMYYSLGIESFAR